MLVLGIIFGSLLSALFSGDFAWQWVPALWVEGFGTSSILRLVVAFLGGIVIGFGSRWAGGCTSGHGISGTMQLAVSGWISAIAFFISGIITAYLMFRIF